MMMVMMMMINNTITIIISQVNLAANKCCNESLNYLMFPRPPQIFLQAELSIYYFSIRFSTYSVAQMSINT